MFRSVPTRCAWIEDAAFSMKRPCNKTLAANSEAYCPKHQRVFAALMARRLIEIMENMERKPSEMGGADC